MFNNLTERLTNTVRHLFGKKQLTEKDLDKTLKEVKKSLIDADVSIKAVKSFVSDIKKEAAYKDIPKGLNPGQFVIQVVNDKLISLMGEKNESLDLKATPPVVILLSGLQGSGKTTMAAKLANFLIKKENKKVAVVSTDIYRPAAIEQLAKIAEDAGVPVIPSNNTQKPKDIVNLALKEANVKQLDVLVIDTAGRLSIDEEMMEEIKELSAVSNPTESLLVVDSMTGQDAIVTAEKFNKALPLTGVILSKLDGDTRGGAALSIRFITGKPIKFVGVGEKIDQIEAFHPDRIASRILGMGDMLSLIEDINDKIDKEQAEKLQKKVMKGKGFNFNDLKEQLLQVKKVGSFGDIMDKLPGMGKLPEHVKDPKVHEKMTKTIIAIIDSMTKKERVFPNIIRGSRKKRIAKGAGVEVQEVNKAIKQLDQMQKMMRKFKNPASMKRMFDAIKGKLPNNFQM